MKKYIFFILLLLGAISSIISSCEKIHHRIDENIHYEDSEGNINDTTLVPITINLPEVSFTQKEFYSANLESEAILNSIIALIDAAEPESSIYMCINQINHEGILEAFKRADNRGVNLNLLIDMSRVEPQRVNPAAFNFLRGADMKNTQIWETYNDIADAAINENRFILFSKIETTEGSKEHIVFQASSSFTVADSRGAQDAITLSDEELYHAYLKYWNEMKDRAISGMTGYNYFFEILNAGNTEAHFMPYRNNGAVISGDVSLDFLNRISDPATAEVRIAMAFWDDNRIAILDKLIELVEQGAKVEIVLKSNVAATLSRFEVFESKGGFVRILNVNDNERPLTNFGSRFMLINGTYDGVVGTKVTVTGTLSFTANSLRNSNTAVILLKDDEVYNRYETFFNDLRSLPEYRASGPIYAGFPETFEHVPGLTGTGGTADVGVYIAGFDTPIYLSTGVWTFDNSGFRNQVTDKIVSPSHAWRSARPATGPSTYLAMAFDVPNGASKVSFYYGTWGNQSGANLGAPCTFALEYSTNQGSTWTQIGNVITEAAWTAKQVSFDVDIEGPVRFRIHRFGSPTNGADNGSLNIDDFAIYQKK
ncbi:hypothetical protein G5B00_00960 [Parapedobacter sp. SGR-10]|uniref:phospholipase D-like domain-containing protein n=1 Tax=Parapedobacter sp. SGR-10 TaxID=2710879 RepID=UPI0013D601E0|nr:phospholipase D-like domain-containing protein [Parapedobacter sp. SGR-10]NGF55066.1 hypothetical protein [Parapedobacter sp. SGR-10]